MKKILAFALAALMLFALSACGKKETKTLTLATSADFPPYEYVDDNGQYAGIDIEVAGKIAEKLGMELKVENMEFNAVVTSVSSGKYDIGMAGLTVDQERKQSVN